VELLTQATCLKFIATFRNQFDGPLLSAVLPLLARLMTSTSYVVHSYAAATLDKCLMVRRSRARCRCRCVRSARLTRAWRDCCVMQVKDSMVDVAGNSVSTLRIPRETLAPLCPEFIRILFGIMNTPGYRENEYLIKCVTRLVAQCGATILPIAGDILSNTTAILARVRLRLSVAISCLSRGTVLVSLL
jgi:exportin-2 (importin alpha re-exporter)